MKFTSELFSKTILFLFPLLVQTWAKVDVYDDPNDVLLDEQNLRTREIDHRSLQTQNWPLVNEGTLGVAVVKVEARTDDNRGSLTVNIFSEQLYSDVNGFFETDEFNAAAQFDSCSYGKLTIESDNDERIVHEVTLPKTLGNYKTNNQVQWSNLQNAIDQQLTETTNVTVNPNVTNIIVVTPFDVQLQYQQGSPIEVLSRKYLFLDENSWSLFNIVHGLGRQMGLSLSGDEKDPTSGDSTGYMGQELNPELPDIWFTTSTYRRCFNAAKSWQLGWYEDKSLVINLTEKSYKFKLSPVTEHGHRLTNAYTVVKINIPSSPYDYYMMYNRQESFNDGTADNINAVTTVRADKRFKESSLQLKPLIMYPTLWYHDYLDIMDFDSSGRWMRIKLQKVRGSRGVQPGFMSVEIKVKTTPPPPPLP